MIINYNLKGNERKKLVQAIAECLQEKEEYQGAPSYNYKVGDVIIDKEGNVEVDDIKSDDLISMLKEKGFNSETEEVKVAIQIPMYDMDEKAITNLKNLIKSKGKLIMKALDAINLEVNIVDGKLDFMWFKPNEEPDKIKANMKFVTALCELAKNSKRISDHEKEMANEKYAFRCFLLRLGFIGDDFKRERKALLKNLEGNSAFKSPKDGDDKNEND